MMKGMIECLFEWSMKKEGGGGPDEVVYVPQERTDHPRRSFSHSMTLNSNRSQDLRRNLSTQVTTDYCLIRYALRWASLRT